MENYKISEILNEHENEVFSSSLMKLNNHIKIDIDKYEKDEYDEFVMDGLNYFYKNDYGIPSEIYKGFSLEDISNFYNELLRKIKLIIKELCGKNYFKDTSSFTIKNLTQYILEELDVEVTLIKLILFNLLEFIRKKMLGSLCVLSKDW